MDVGAWLRGLGLERYEAGVPRNDVDAGLLPTLTADDLRELGVPRSATASSCWPPSPPRPRQPARELRTAGARLPTAPSERKPSGASSR